MKNSTVAVGVILLVAGLLMFFAGQGIYNNASKNYQIAKMTYGLFGGGTPSSYKTTMDFGAGLIFISIIMVISSFIVMLVGVTREAKSTDTIEKKLIKEKEDKKTVEKTPEPVKEILKDTRYCFSCGVKLEESPKFCYKCGTKLR